MAWKFPPTVLVLVIFAGWGCTSTFRVTDSTRSGTQQLLQNTAFDSVIEAVDFHPLAGTLVFLDTENLDADGKGYVVYRIREQMSKYGIRQAVEREDADIVVEVGMRAFGTDSENHFLGIRGVGLAIFGDFFGMAGPVPEITLRNRENQFAVAELSMFAHLQETGDPFWRVGPLRADTYHSQETVLGTGPYRRGSIEHSANRSRRFGFR